MLYSDLRQLKIELDVDPNDTSEDKKFALWLEAATHLIESLFNRKFAYRSTTEYYQGTGTQKLVLRRRPVFPNPTNQPTFSPINVVFDDMGYFGAASGAFTTDSTTIPLIYGVDYTLRIDQDDGSSKSGVLYRINDLWTKPQVRQVGYLSPFIGPDLGSYQVTYTAGFTVDTLPPEFRTACNLLVAQLRHAFPLGLAIGGESYEDRSISVIGDKRDYMLTLIKPLLHPYRNLFF